MKIFLVCILNLKSCNCIDKTCDSGSLQQQGVKNYSLLSYIVNYHKSNGLSRSQNLNMLRDQGAEMTTIVVP